MYLTPTRRDLMFVVSLVHRCMRRPTQMHHQVVKKIMRYLQGFVDLGIFQGSKEKLELKSCTNSDYGYVFLLGTEVI